jgi:hypothetical protein
LLAICDMTPTRPVQRTDRTIPGAANRTCRAIFAALASVAVSRFAAPLFAQAVDRDPCTPPPHVRPAPELRALVDEATRRSLAIRVLRAQLEAFDITVYIRSRVFAERDLDGRIAMLAVHGPHRYLVIELSCTRSTLVQMATLGHELFHAVEIAGEPSVIDAGSLAALYGRIGVETGDSVGRRTFETDAAADAGRRARRELLGNTRRSGNGS